MKIKGTITRKSFKEIGMAHYTAGHHKVPRLWVVVADKHGAKIFSKAGISIELIGEAFPSGNGKKIENKEMGRTTGSSGGPSHIKYEPSMSPSRRKALRFAHEIADWLGEALQKDVFDRLILVAPPQMLGDLRQALSKPLASRLLAEINKDLTKLDEQELQTQMEKIAWF